MKKKIIKMLGKLSLLLDVPVSMSLSSSGVPLLLSSLKYHLPPLPVRQYCHSLLVALWKPCLLH